MNQTVENVFNGISSVANGAAAACSGIQTGFTTFETLQNQRMQQQQQGQAGDFSRRNMPQFQQAQYQYQPPIYPWADANYTGYGFGVQPTMMNVGYPGITNPNYGKVGFYRQQTQVGAWGSSMRSNNNGMIGGGWAW